MEHIQVYMRQWLGFDPDFTLRLVTTVLALIVLLGVRFLVLRVVSGRSPDVRVRYNWRKGTTYVTFLLAILIVGRTWFTGFQSVTTYLGLLSAGIAIALKDPIVNLAGWAFIMWRRPFTVGDRVELGSYRGDVIDLRLFQFTLMEIGNWVDADQSTGRVVRIPNGKVFTEMLANYSKGFQYIWDELPVLITFESNWRSAKTLLSDIGARHAEHLTGEAERTVREASARMMIFYRTLTPTVYTSVRDCGVLLTIRYLCEPRERRATQQAIWEDILTAFADCHDIDFAYPTQRFFDNASEGKPGTKGGRIGPGTDETTPR